MKQHGLTDLAQEWDRRAIILERELAERDASDTVTMLPERRHYLVGAAESYRICARELRAAAYGMAQAKLMVEVDQ